MQETAIKVNERLDKKGKRLEDVSPQEFRDILYDVTEKMGRRQRRLNLLILNAANGSSAFCWLRRRLITRCNLPKLPKMRRERRWLGFPKKVV